MPGPASALHYLLLIFELLTLFVALPLAFRFKLIRIPPIPALWILTAYCLYCLLADPKFHRSLLWNPQALPTAAPNILAVFAGLALLVGAGVYFMAPWLLFNFVRRAPMFWAAVMLLYPVLSVYPQGIVYRAFFFERYWLLFPNPLALIAASAIAFSFAHIIFRNPIALGLNSCRWSAVRLALRPHGLALHFRTRARSLRLLDVHHRLGRILLQGARSLG